MKRMIKSWLLILLTISNALYSQEKEVVCDSIKWSKDYKLKWSDFKGAVPFGNLGIKKAASSLNIKVAAEDYDELDRPIFIIEVYFYKSNSWTIVDTDDILKHEQGHFDLAEIYARKLRKLYNELYEQKETSPEKYYIVFNDNSKELSERHKQYDKEVYFIEENQIKWCKKIAEELEELKEYELKSTCNKM